MRSRGRAVKAFRWFVVAALLGIFWCGGVLVPGVARAQATATEEPPDAFEESLLKYRSFFDYGGFEPQLDSLLPKGGQSRWTPHVGVEATYSDNVDKTARSKDGFWVNGVAGLEWFRRTPRFTGMADYRYNTPVYRSEHVSDRTYGGHRVSGVARWQASQGFQMSAGGHAAQSLEAGLISPAPDLPATYNNRSNEYGAHGDYAWQIGRGVSNRGSYRFGYVDYVSDDAESTDTQTHNATEDLRMQVGGRDDLQLNYNYASEADVGGDYRRQNHSGSATWSHRVLSFPATDESFAHLSLQTNRIVYEGTESDSYWDNAVSAGYSLRPGPTTSVGLNAGYQYIRPDAGKNKQGWNAGGEIEQRFGQHTTGRAEVAGRLQYLPDVGDAERTVDYRVSLEHRLSELTAMDVVVSQSWDYAPATSTSSGTELTKNLQARLSLRTRFARKLTGRFAAGARRGEVVGTRTAGHDYWEADGTGDLEFSVGETGFLGAGYGLTRRETEATGDDYLLHRVRVFARQQVLSWLSARAEYRFEKRTYDEGREGIDYQENRLFGSLTASW